MQGSRSSGKALSSTLESLSVLVTSLALSSRDVSSLKRWTLRHWTGPGIVQKEGRDDPERRLLVRAATEAFRRNGVRVGRVRTWLNIQKPDYSEGAYPDIYPHVHADTDGTTLVVYLDPGDVPAPLEILVDGEIVDTIYPESGRGVIIPNGVWHAVHKNRGTRDRVAAIVTAYP